MATSDPRKQKALGRGTRGFDPAVWDKVGFEVVVQGNLAKFRQNPDFREVLLATGDKVRTTVVVCVRGRRVVCARNPQEDLFHVRGGCPHWGWCVCVEDAGALF